MKKLLIVLAFASFSVASFAQEDPTEKYSVGTNSFWSNWFIEAGANWNAWYSSEEHVGVGKSISKNPFKGDRSNPGVSVAIGKWFTPGLGLRLKGQGIWGKTVESGVITPAGEIATATGAGNKYWILNGHAMFNLSNLILGYKEARTINIIPFIGGGIGRTMTHNLYAMDLSAGIQALFLINKNVGIHAELGWNRLEGDIDGGTQSTNAHRGWDSHDNNVYAQLGLTLNLGKATWKKVPDVEALKAQHQAALDAANARANDLANENARLQQLLKDAQNKPVERISESVKEFITTPVSVFFNLAKVDVANPKDLVNVRALAKYAKDNDANILVTGYADSATGSAEINEKLSLKRAETVKNELIGMGVAESKITTAHAGGVNILGVDLPKDFDRRATVQVTEIPEKK